MAINRLTDIVSIFETKWIYGDSKFEYDFEINKDHDIQYPVLQIEPPESTIPEIYNGREEYEFEINFYNLYSQAAQDVVTLQKRWDNLQDLAMEWLDMVLKHYQDSTVEAYLNDESVEIERIKEVANDRLVQIKMSFTMSGFTKCFRPQSSYPSGIDADNLVVWLRADAGLTFDIPTKKISAWADQSGISNDVSQSTSASQPLRYGYDGASDKARIEFNGTSDYFNSDANSPLSTESFSIFTVAKTTTNPTNDARYFTYKDTVGVDKILLSSSADRVSLKVTDDNGTEAEARSSAIDLTTSYHIASARFDGSAGTLYLQYNNQTEDSSSIAGFTHAGAWDDRIFTIGWEQPSGLANNYLKGDIQEIIIYKTLLSDADRDKIKNYLNNKYNIY